MNPIVSSREGNSVTIQWTKYKEENVHVDSYKVRYWNGTDPMEEKNVKAPKCKAESLKANTEYQFQVAGKWKTHCGPFSEVLRFKTLGGEYTGFFKLRT